MEPTVVFRSIRLAMDPEHRTTRTGQAAGGVKIPIQARQKDQSGEWANVGETVWLRCKAFGRAADDLCRYRKGDYVTLTGRMSVDAPWTTRDGEPQPAVLVLMVQDVQEAEQSERAGQPRPASRPASRDVDLP